MILIIHIHTESGEKEKIQIKQRHSKTKERSRLQTIKGKATIFWFSKTQVQLLLALDVQNATLQKIVMDGETVPNSDYELNLNHIADQSIKTNRSQFDLGITGSVSCREAKVPQFPKPQEISQPIWLPLMPQKNTTVLTNRGFKKKQFKSSDFHNVWIKSPTLCVQFIIEVNRTRDRMLPSRI